MGKSRNLAGLLDVNGDVYDDALDNILKEIAQTKAETAVDVFVYDTRKDSDGGAWRKRTQHTSWYNETLNTATRGSRKEFPAVAVIVAERGVATGVITIYDGDDPSLPMWRRFDKSTTTAGLGIFRNTENYLISSVIALNGIIACGFNNNENNTGLQGFNLVKDTAFKHDNQSAFTGYLDGLVNYIDTNITISSEVGSIVNDYVNDVAMTVLPNAPIDAATGLPVPTIAVATDGGVSVIKDDGSVVDDTSVLYIDNSAHEIDFTSDNRILRTNRNKNYVSISDIPSSDTSTVASNTIAISALDRIIPTTAAIEYRFAGNHGTNDVKAMKDTLFAAGASSGLNIADASSIISDGVGNAAYITSDYNTGWMNGDIKLATLSDTDTTDLVGTELVTNGTFDTDTSGWEILSPATHTVTSGEYVLTTTGSGQGASQSFSTVVGETYVVSADVRNGTASSTFLVATYSANQFSGSYGYASTSSSTTVSLQVTFTADSTTSWVYLRGGSAGTHIFDNISVRLAEEDRSVNGNGLQVFGTVTKEPVATGADLVAYSGFSASNYLKQPYNPDLEIGINDASWIVWAKTSTYTSQEMIVSRESPTYGTAFNIQVLLGKINFSVTNDSFSTYTAIFNDVSRADDSWHCYVFTKQGNVYSGYIDGVLVGSGTYDAELFDENGDESICVGERNGSAVGTYTGSISLARFSHTAPTAEQIAKIYEDEKVLFQENAQATLYGTSDAVTALAYDDGTDLLHVGTSAGRSDFSGLRRVSNTTDAVGSAISASNGLIAED